METTDGGALRIPSVVATPVGRFLGNRREHDGERSGAGHDMAGRLKGGRIQLSRGGAFSSYGDAHAAPILGLISSTMISGIGSNGLLAVPLQGIQRGMEQLNTAAGRVAEGDVSPENVVQQIQAEVMVKANAMTARTVDTILGSLLDTLA